MASRISVATSSPAPQNTSLVTLNDVDGVAAIGHAVMHSVGGVATLVSPSAPLPVVNTTENVTLTGIAVSATATATATGATATAAGAPTDLAYGGSGTSTIVGVLKGIYARLAGGLGITGAVTLGAGSAAVGTVTVSNLPGTQPVSGTVALGAGSAAIGTVGVAGALPSGGNVIGGVTISGALPVGGNAIGSVSVSNFPAPAAIPAGSNVIGLVAQSGTWTVALSGSLPAGANTLGALTPLVVTAAAAGTPRTITTGGNSQTGLATNSSRKSFLLKNPAAATEPLYFAFAATADATSISLAPGEGYTWHAPSQTYQGAIAVYAATTGHAFSLVEFV